MPEEFERWRADGLPFVIEYSREAMEGVRAEVVDGLYRLAKGGLEVGGVLFGSRSGELVRILAARPLACAHASGPAFVLSDKDLAGLKTLLESAGADPELAGLVPVGWYHSHTRSKISLSEQDLEVFKRYFPEPWQIALILHPAKMASTRAAFFFREWASQEFPLEPLPKLRKAPPVKATAEEPAPVEEPPAADPPPRRSNRLPWVLFALAWCVAIAATAIATRSLWAPQPVAAPAPPPARMVEAIQRAEQLQHEVDRLNTELQSATERNRELEKSLPAKKRGTTRSNAGRGKR